MAILRPTIVPLQDEEAIGRSALRKASMRLLPLIAIGYGIAYMDRVNISFAALQMNQELHFSASVYGFGAGLFFLSYAACEVPSNLLLVRFGARRWLGRIMFTWGLLSIGMLFVKTPHQFYAMRFLLGVAEAGFFPGVIFYLSQWFPASNRSRAISRFYISLPLSSVVMGALAGALLHLQGRLELAGWQWLFVVEGLPAIILSVVFLICLPDGPTQARWLDPEEQAWLIHQLRTDDLAAAEIHSGGEVQYALRQVRVWVLGIFLLCIYIGNYGYAFTAPTIIQKATGFNATDVGFVVAALGVLGAISMLLNGAHSDRTGERHLHIIFPCLLIAAGYLGAGLSMQPAVALPAFACIVAGFSALNAVIWTIPSNFLTGKSAAAGIAAVNMIGMIGGFLGPYWMGHAADLAGGYQGGLLTLVVPSLIATLIMFGIRRDALRRKAAAVTSL
ncbi:MAG TPA: MFS transporter [Acidobacteriaceae bacterium]|nr:MFS transporter [Acidobacteriaceae bacterium]